jgi:hypothetical protein
MAMCLIMQFAGVNAATYEAVMKELGLRGANPDWPSGMMSHVAGFTSDGMWWMFGNRRRTLTLLWRVDCSRPLKLSAVYRCLRSPRSMFTTATLPELPRSIVIGSGIV